MLSPGIRMSVGDRVGLQYSAQRQCNIVPILHTVRVTRPRRLGVSMGKVNKPHRIRREAVNHRPDIISTFQIFRSSSNRDTSSSGFSFPSTSEHIEPILETSSRCLLHGAARPGLLPLLLRFVCVHCQSGCLGASNILTTEQSHARPAVRHGGR